MNLKRDTIFNGLLGQYDSANSYAVEPFSSKPIALAEPQAPRAGNVKILSRHFSASNLSTILNLKRTHIRCEMPF